MTPDRAKPAVGTGGHRDFVVSNWKAHRKNTLQGFLSLTLSSGLVIHNVTLHEKNGKRWIGMPGRTYAASDGTTTYAPIVDFASREKHARFQEMALTAVESFLKGRGEW